MLSRLLARLTYAKVIATLALFMVLAGGIAWALEANSVRSRHIVNGQVKPVDLQEGESSNLLDSELNDGSFGGTLPPRDQCWWALAGQPRGLPTYFRDRDGVVHVEGSVRAIHGDTAGCGSQPVGAGANSRVLTLPPGYTPSGKSSFVVVSSGTPVSVELLSDGPLSVTPSGTWLMFTDYLTLDGISFRCAPSGENGCP